MPAVSKYNKLALLSSVGIMFPISIAIGGGVGYYLDGKLGTFPFLSMVFFILGIVAAFVNMFRAVRTFDEPD